MKKRYYLFIIIIEFALMLLFSKILNIGTGNTWLGTVSVDIMFLTVVIMLIDIAKSIKQKNKYLFYFIIFVIIIIIISTIITNIIFFSGF